MKNGQIILVIVILAILFLFGIYNAQLVQLTLFNYQTPHLPLFLVLIFVFFSGFFLAALFYGWKLSRLRRQLDVARREKEVLQMEVAKRNESLNP